MSILKIFRKKPATAPAAEPQDEEIEEYEVATFVPKKLPMTGELLRRQREDEIRKKYCRPTVKTGIMM